MLLFSLISYGVVMAFGSSHTVEKDRKVVVASFYPVELMLKELTKETEDVTVVNLTENHTGCLHDYQLTTKDMITLKAADVLVMNGGEMELFLEHVIEDMDVPVIDASEGMELLAGEEHDESESETEHEHEHNHGSVNGHVWMNISRYREQLHHVTEELCRVDFENADLYLSAANRYDAELAEFQAEYKERLTGFAGMEVVIFHDAFAYLCEELDMEVIHSIDLDADTALSAGEIAEISNEIRYHSVPVLLAEESTGAVARQIAEETGARVVYLNPVTAKVTGKTYLDFMRENLEVLASLEK